jgi:hypothetical protein
VTSQAIEKKKECIEQLFRINSNTTLNIFIIRYTGKEKTVRNNIVCLTPVDDCDEIQKMFNNGRVCGDNKILLWVRGIQNIHQAIKMFYMIFTRKRGPLSRSIMAIAVFLQLVKQDDKAELYVVKYKPRAEITAVDP